MELTASIRFPRRPVDVGTFSPEYTPAELRLISYVNAVVRHSEAPGEELAEAAERIRIDSKYWSFRDSERAEIDERIEQPVPQPCPPAPKPAEGLPLCQNAIPPASCCKVVEASSCDCGG